MNSSDENMPEQSLPTAESQVQTMSPEEWERRADEFAAAATVELTELENRFWPEPEHGSFRGFWPVVRSLNERVRIAPAIKLDDKLSLQHRINELCQRARRDQRQLEDQAQRRRSELMEALVLAGDMLQDAQSVEQVQEVRADLQAIRERIGTSTSVLQRAGLREVWETWQRMNQSAWERLNALWQNNEQQLSEMLQSARETIERGDPRAAKEQIKAFHEAAKVLETSHKALRALREQAGGLWRAANEVGAQKREAYRASAGRRLGQWQMAQQRNERQRVELLRQIADLEDRIARTQTGMGVALLRGQLTERQRSLEDLEDQQRDLSRRISAAEESLSKP